MEKNEYSLAELMEMDDLSIFQPIERIDILGFLFEHARETNDKTIITKALDFADNEDVINYDGELAAVFHYFFSNGWSYLGKMNYESPLEEEIVIDNAAREQVIIHLRLAHQLLDKLDNNVIKAQICTNLGNTLSEMGRFVESIAFWKQAQELIPTFGMAVGNLGKGLHHYAHAHYDPGQQWVLGKLANSYLQAAGKMKMEYPEAAVHFNQLAEEIAGYYGRTELEQEMNWDNFSLGEIAEEIDYRKWCMQNTLFLNPLNDAINKNIVAHDCLLLPSIRLRKHESPFHLTLFNQLKQEFVSSRFLLYTSTQSSKVHFSDKENLQADTLDYANYSFAVEQLKTAYRTTYSLFDKIAYLLNHHFKLRIPNNKVNFRTVWFAHNDKGNRLQTMHAGLPVSTNWPLRGLYWLSKDLIENDSAFTRSIAPEARELATIRNFMEHKSFKVTDFGDSQLTDEGLTYTISRSDLERKTLKLMQLSRAAMIYLSFAIHREELDQEPDGPILPINFLPLDDEWKT